MCSRIMTLVFTVTLQILTVRNCTESRTDVLLHCLMHCRTLHRVGTGLRRGYWSDKGKKTKNSWYTSWRCPCCGRPRHWCLALWLSGSLALRLSGALGSGSPAPAHPLWLSLVRLSRHQALSLSAGSLDPRGFRNSSLWTLWRKFRL